jgi:hypothetical protein
MIAFIGTLLRGAVEGVVEAFGERDRLEHEIAEALEREQAKQREIERLTARVDMVERLALAYQDSNSALLRAREWIAVTDRLPDTRGAMHCSVPVLIHDELGPCVRAYYANGGWYSGTNVTHWMPLPEPPKERGDG